MEMYQDQAFLDFLQQNQGRGNIKVHLIIQGGAKPIEGAHVIVSKIIDGVSYKMAESHTDANGISEFLGLPALAKEFSLSPALVPYAGIIYDLFISRSGFLDGYATVPVFDTITTIHEMSPLNNFSNQL